MTDYSVDFSENNDGDLIFEGKTVHIREDAWVHVEYLPDGDYFVRYRAYGRDDNGALYQITWDTTEEWDKNTTEEWDQDMACDWSNPSEVEAISGDDPEYAITLDHSLSAEEIAQRQAAEASAARLREKFKIQNL